jgi:hypothetical protein
MCSHEWIKNDQHPAAALEGFLKKRRDSLAWLKALDAPNWEIKLTATFSEESYIFSVGDMLVSWMGPRLFAHPSDQRTAVRLE